MAIAEAEAPLSAADAAALFADLAELPALLLAVSGGPDSTALMVLIAQWRAHLRRGPDLMAATVDHGLREGSRAEAMQVASLAQRLGIPHRTLVWRGEKPTTGLQEAARAARYKLLAQAARRAGIAHVVTAHTRDDQAETVLFRLARGSGIAGLGGMAPFAPMPGVTGLTLARPLLEVPKARLVATLDRTGIAYADDPTNRDVRYARARLRAVMPALAAEGLDAARLATLAARARRAEGALEWAAEEAIRRQPQAVAAPFGGRQVASAMELQTWPTEIALRVLRRHIEAEGTEGPVELGKLEALLAALIMAVTSGQRRWRRTLAGAAVTLDGGRIFVEPAPPRRSATGTERRRRAAAAAARLSPARRRDISR